MEPAPTDEQLLDRLTRFSSTAHHDIGTEPDEQLLDRLFSIAERSDDSDDVPPLSIEALATEARELMGNWSYTQSWLQHLAVHTGWSYNWMCGLLLPDGATDPVESFGTALTSSDRPPRLRSSSWRLLLLHRFFSPGDRLPQISDIFGDGALLQLLCVLSPQCLLNLSAGSRALRCHATCDDVYR